jgi:ankyrin repeat protein
LIYVASFVGPKNSKELGLPGTYHVPKEPEPGLMKGVDLVTASDTSGPKERSISPSNISPFLKAAMQGNYGVVVSLIDQGTDVEEINSEGRTALMISASNGSLDMINTLLHAGANVNATSEKGWTALMVTIKNADSQTAELLLQNGADVNHLSPDRWTALAEATNQGQTALMEKLLDYGADPETKSSHDWTPLMHAAYRGDQVGVKLLLRAGANVNGSSQRDETALLLAAAGGHTEIVRILLGAGAAPEPYWVTSPLEKEGEGNKAESLAGGTNKDEGGPEERSVALGWTPLMLACQNGCEEMVLMLLDRGVSLEPKSPYGKVAIEIARENARMGVVELLSRNPC